MSLIHTVVGKFPKPVRELMLKHRELLKFAFVGGTTFVIDTAIFYGLKLTILHDRPVTSKVIAVLVATIVSYVLNREWSFRQRGGREKRHEAALYFLVSGIGVGIYAFPLFFSRYVLDLRFPDVSVTYQELGDFFIGQIGGVLVGMVFRWWAFRKFVFPEENARPRARAGSVARNGDADSDEEFGHS
ncbi:GtrA family protein [Allokutzneria sp. NRRL B-24872]|uniref:GtrA family protein n=1 Tax=Allokutzneria sp. NRRL B-24872 TaxID=1137961 RepID=UPI001AF028AD|nr:GtrA family protein [Allokutzneria sp. NRRL B-24872]